jgi:hypothetical protein
MLPIIPWAGNFSILLLKCLDSRHADVAAGSDENNREESEGAMSLERPGTCSSKTLDSANASQGFTHLWINRKDSLVMRLVGTIKETNSAANK